VAGLRRQTSRRRRVAISYSPRRSKKSIAKLQTPYAVLLWKECTGLLVRLAGAVDRMMSFSPALFWCLRRAKRE